MSTEDELRAATPPTFANRVSDSMLKDVAFWTTLLGLLVVIFAVPQIRNVILLGERGKRATQEQTSGFLARLARLPISIAAIPDEARLMDLSRRHRLTFYDAAYLELAQREAIPLATLDKELVAAARAEDVSLILAAP